MVRFGLESQSNKEDAGRESMKTISVVINTDGRSKSLRETIGSLRHQNYSEFEVCVIYGPTEDGTRELVEEYQQAGALKAKYCAERNLSQSRNLGIAMSAGQIVAFIDDDAIPEPEWLSQLVEAYEDPKVKAAGGKVFDHTGYTYQYLYAACDRLGNALLDLKDSAEDKNFPLSAVIPYIQGTNSSFDRCALTSIGGFDEEYEFYLDETDTCCRMVDAGYFIKQLDNAVVHHKYLQSSIRDENRITTFKYPVIKNKVYFSVINNYGHTSFQNILQDACGFAGRQREDLVFHVRHGRLNPTILEEFDEQCELALRTGLSRGLSGQRKLRSAAFFTNPDPFKRFQRIAPAGPKHTFVFLSQNYPPGPPGGNARHTADIAQGIADVGHTVHVLTRGSGHNRVDFENGVWVHRLIEKRHIDEYLSSGEKLPDRIWNYSRSLLEEIDRISRFRKIDVVEATSWDCEDFALILDGRFPVATNIVTTLTHWLESHNEEASNEDWLGEFARPMLIAEKLMFDRSDLIIAASKAIENSIVDLYGIRSYFASRVAPCVHGLIDITTLTRRRPRKLVRGTMDGVRLLFVGRLELRKGIDLLLEVVPGLLNDYPNLEIWIAGDDSIVVDEGKTAKEGFLTANIGNVNLDKVHFLGVVDDEEMRWLFANCDIFCSPSRFESFGLIFVEAMMFGKPSVAFGTGGVPEVIKDGVTGILADVNSESLKQSIALLLDSPEKRLQMGSEGRLEFERKFEVGVIVPQRIAALTSIMREELTDEEVLLPMDCRVVSVASNAEGIWLGLRKEVVIRSGQGTSICLTFWAHPWSGIADIYCGDVWVDEVDLYHPSGAYRSYKLSVPKPEDIRIVRSGRKNDSSNDSEIIYYKAQRDLLAKTNSI